jgi:hypothetical protein
MAEGTVPSSLDFMSQEKPRIPTAEERLDEWMRMSKRTMVTIQAERVRIFTEIKTHPSRDKWDRLLQLTDQIWEVADMCAKVAAQDKRCKPDADKCRKIATDMLEFHRLLEKSGMTTGDFQALLDEPVKNL